MKNCSTILIGFCLTALLLAPACVPGNPPPTMPESEADSGATKVTVEELIKLREFASLEELKSWLAEDNTDECVHLVVGEDGSYRLDVEYCDMYALQLQRQVARSRFLMSTTIIEEQGKPDMINLGCIGNDIYHIDPQIDEVWFYCHKD